MLLFFENLYSQKLGVDMLIPVLVATGPLTSSQSERVPHNKACKSVISYSPPSITTITASKPIHNCEKQIQDINSYLNLMLK